MSDFEEVRSIVNFELQTALEFSDYERAERIQKLMDYLLVHQQPRAWELVWPGPHSEDYRVVTKDERVRDAWIDGYGQNGAEINPLFSR